MTGTVAPAEERPALPSSVEVYRDDQSVALAVGRALGPRLPVPGMVLLLLGVGAILALAAFAGSDASLGVAAVGVAWLLLTMGTTSKRWPKESFHWAVPPLVRLGEYATLAWLAAIDDALPAAFALIAALTFRHYDLVYRLRHRGVVPARWVSRLSGGWDGRLIVAFLLLAAGALPAGYFVAAGVLGVAFVSEAVYGWLAVGRVQRPLDYEDEEDEGQ